MYQQCFAFSRDNSIPNIKKQNRRTERYDWFQWVSLTLFGMSVCCCFIQYVCYLYEENKSISSVTLLNCVSCVLKLCSRVNVSCVLTFTRAKVPCVLKYSRGNVYCVLRCYCMGTCSCANVLHVSTYLAYLCIHVSTQLVNMPWVPCLTRLPWPRDHLPTCFTSSVSSFYVTFFSFTVIVVEVKHAVGKVSEFNQFFSLVTWIHIQFQIS